ncbi:hypothetical protein [Streptomyces sp. CL12]|uniref:hypothetical protein n=1 Tax=Streptomyces sp. CL12 TaxID=3391744 RepID=UPI003A7F80C5
MGPRLLFRTLDDLRGRCDITSVQQIRDKPGYDDAALAPGSDWAPMTSDDTEHLRVDSATPDSTLIELVHQPLPGLAPDDLAGRRRTAALLEPMDGYRPATLLGCASSPGDRLTTTEDHTTGRRIGLHVDNFDRLSYSARHQGRRRLCLNLGPGPRYLLICDHDVQEICRALYADTDLKRHFPHTEDVRRYVVAGHPLRCLRIRLEPGDGYIAPTEFLPHDGSTAGIDKPSVAAFWLGRSPNVTGRGTT